MILVIKNLINNIAIEIDLCSEENFIIELLNIAPQRTVDYLKNSIKSEEGLFEKLVIFLKENSEKHLHIFLHHLHLNDKILSVGFNHLQPRLYVEYAPELLLSFLKSTSEYSTDEVLQLCGDNHLFKEVVYILEKKGSK